MVMTGCKSSKTVTDAGQVSADNRRIPELAMAAQPDFTSLDIKRMNLTVAMSGGQSYSSPATGRFIRDSVIHISVQPFFGIEMFVARFTKESFLVVDKMRKIVYTGTYSQFSDQFGISLDFTTIEALLTNRLFVVNGASLTTLKPTTKDGVMYLSRTSTSFRQQFTLGSDYTIRRSEVSLPDEDAQFVADYDQFTDQNGLMFPFRHQLNLSAGSKKFDLTIVLTRLVANEPINIPEISTAGYKVGNSVKFLK